MNKKSSKSRILVTGGAGFIGSHLCASLLQEGHEVSVIDNLSTGKIENIEALRLNPHFHFHQESIFNAAFLEKLVENNDKIFHLAAAVGVKLIMEDTLGTIQTNIRGTEVILEAALKYKKPVFIASTSEVYGKSEQLPFSEENNLVLGSTSRNRWAYAASKIVDEFLALAYYREKKLPVIIFRFFNTVGTRQSAQYGMVLPRFIKQALKNEPLTVYDDGQQSRCFCDVEDAVRAIITLSETPEALGQIFNIGSTHSITIEKLALKVLEIIQNEFNHPVPSIKKIPYHEVYEEGFEDIRHRQPDISKIKELISWNPQVSLDETIRRIVKSLL